MKTILSWSSGKDCAWALHVLREQAAHEVVGLMTTVNATANRVAMHAVRHDLLQSQAAAVGLPLLEVPIPSPCSNREYETAMSAAASRMRADGVQAVAFGDLFLEDVRRYRETKLAPTGITALFPLFGMPTGELARAMIVAGVRARITCVDPKQLDPSFAGRSFDASFLDDLPVGVDPCGENGEFHSFAYAGPMFAEPLAIEPGAVVERDGFVFADILPGQASAAQRP
jgi:uncharacterized protein (TIGR00290 family)